MGRFVIQGSNVSLPLPGTKPVAFVGREDPVSNNFPEIDLDPHNGLDKGVGRQHARLFIQGGQLMLEDLNSVNGTLVNKQKLLPKQPRPLNNGDEVYFGQFVVHYYSS
jgi:pSer/pThr/pTyr-binding forkhead associated (FHA) protein